MEPRPRQHTLPGAAGTRGRAGAEADVEMGVRLSERDDGARAPDDCGGRVFVGSTSGAVYALDMQSGCTVWVYQAKSGVRSGIVIAARAGAPGKVTAYFGD